MNTPLKGKLSELRGMSAYELIERMDAGYPHRCIGLNESPESAHRYAGLREFIDELLDIKQEEETSDEE